MRRTVLLSLPLLALLLVSGCSQSGGSSHSATSNGGAADLGQPDLAGSGTERAAAGAAPNASSTSAGSGQAAGVALQQRQLVRTATVRLTVPDVDRAAQAADDATDQAGGRVDTDDRNTGAAGRQAHLTLRVPAARLDGLLDTVVGLGHETSRNVQGEDVTASVADVNARVTELQISVARLRDFLSRSGSISDLVALESQLTQRESDLQSTVAQQKALADQVQLASLEVDLAVPPPATGSGLPGFPGALQDSLHALLVSVRFTVTALGYLAPFLLLAGGAGYLGLRLYRRRRPTPAPAVADEG